MKVKALVMATAMTLMMMMMMMMVVVMVTMIMAMGSRLVSQKAMLRVRTGVIVSMLVQL